MQLKQLPWFRSVEIQTLLSKTYKVYHTLFVCSYHDYLFQLIFMVPQFKIIFGRHTLWDPMVTITTSDEHCGQVVHSSFYCTLYCSTISGYPVKTRPRNKSTLGCAPTNFVPHFYDFCFRLSELVGYIQQSTLKIQKVKWWVSLHHIVATRGPNFVLSTWKLAVILLNHCA